MGYEVVRSRLEYDGALVKVRVDTVVQTGPGPNVKWSSTWARWDRGDR
jgi:hypothetical protein